MKRIPLLAPVLACTLAAAAAQAAELQVLSAGAIEPGLKAAVAALKSRPVIPPRSLSTPHPN